MTRRSFQRGYVSKPIRTERGVVYVIRYRIRTTDGKWKHKQETLYGLTAKGEAKNALKERLSRLKEEDHAPSTMTLDQFVSTYWVPYLDRKGVKPSTRQGYDSVLERHIRPVLGSMILGEIRPIHIEELLREKAETNLAAKTVRNILALLQSIIALALDNDLIERSPVRQKHKPTVRTEEKPIWTPEQVVDIVENAPPQHRVLFATAALTGARPGEVLGLQWKHITFISDQPVDDDPAGTIRIEQTLWKRKLLPPKTASSNRTVPFHVPLYRELADHRARSVHVGPEDFVFCKSDGSPLSDDVVRRDVLYPILDRLHIPRIKRSSGLHAFRHCAASFANAATGNLKSSSKLLGHSNVRTTANVYTPQ